MKMSLGAAFAAISLATCPNASLAADFPALVRDLNIIQNRMVAGDGKAREDAARQFEHVENAIAAVEPERWADERYIRAAIAYLLCGGGPTALREIYDAGFASGRLGPLLDASLRYAEGQDARGEALLAFDPRDFPPMVGGHIALIQGASLIGTDDARAIELLDLARLLMPGSLVEEAALRREIALLDPLERGEKLRLLATRYASKYLSSPYAENFWKQFQTIYFTVASQESEQSAAGFEAIMENASQAQRLDAYLTLIRKALLQGKFDKANRMLAKAEVVATDANGRKRVSFFRATIKSLAEDDVAGLDAISRVDVNAQDAELARIVSAVMARLSASERKKPTSEKDEEAAQEGGIFAGRQALEQSEALLKRASGK